MKVLFFVFSLLSFCYLNTAQACVPEESSVASVTKKFTQAMNDADYVIVGSVIRLYQLPTWEKGFRGAVVQVIADLKGYAPDYVDGALLPQPGISPTPEQDANYWPTKVEQLNLFAVKKERGALFITAVANAEDEHKYRHCLKLERELQARRQKKQDEEDFKLPEHLKVDHQKEVFGE